MLILKIYLFSYYGKLFSAYCRVTINNKNITCYLVSFIIKTVKFLRLVVLLLYINLNYLGNQLLYKNIVYFYLNNC